MKKLFALAFIGVVFCLAGCNNNITSPDSYNTIYQKDGLLDSISGNCSVVETRWFLLDKFDLTNVSKLKVEFNAFTDADISFIDIFYLNDTGINVMEVVGKNNISNKKSFEIDSPKLKKDYYMRIGLSSSVCTGDLFHIKLRDLKISVK
ncbi:hypothetical protein BH10BAC5_BH10BAC5_24660 [soil metagenome]